MAEKDRSLRLGFTMSAEIARKLQDMREAVRSEGHHLPSQKILVSALIHAGTLDGERLEADVLGPYRHSDPTVSRTGD